MQIAQLLALVIFLSVSFVRANLRGLTENLKHKIRAIDLNVKNCDLALTSLMRHLSRDSTSQNVLKICLKNSSEFSDRGLELICQTCPNLRHFEVKNCKSVTNFGVQSLLQKCKALSHLDLAGKNNSMYFYHKMFLIRV